MTEGIGWIGLVAAKEESLGFYRDGLGLALRESDPNYQYLSAGAEAFLELYVPSARGAARIKRDAPAVGFLVHDLDVAAARLRRYGSDVGETFEEWSSPGERHRWFYVRDPEGNVVVLIERRMSAPIPLLGHVTFAVRDLAAAVAFYRDILGFEVTQQTDELAFLASGSYHHHVGLIRVDDHPPRKAEEIKAHAAFRYGSPTAARAVLERLQGLGVSIEHAADHGVGEAIYFRDPDGNGLEVYCDRPRDKWPREASGRLDMRSRPIPIEQAFQIPAETNGSYRQA